MKKFEQYIVAANDSIRDAVKKMDIDNVDLLIVVSNENCVVGVFTSGDFRSAVLKGVDINNDVGSIANVNFLYLNVGYLSEEASKIFSNDAVSVIPVIDDQRFVVDIVRREYYFGSQDDHDKSLNSNVPTVIMAGGKGSRLKPFTTILPKPLIPIGDDPIIKVIMDKFVSFGFEIFYVTLNDKAKMVRAYFYDHELNYDIEFVEEKKPLGTAGSLKLLINKLNNVFFVSNCDIIVKNNYAEILSFHLKGKYALTLVASMRRQTISYGVCSVNEHGELKEILEKPEYDFLVNTGLYVVDPKVLDFIPDDTYFDMTDLIDKVRDRGLKVGVFPVSEKSWLDIGQWTEYQNTLEYLNI